MLKHALIQKGLLCFQAHFTSNDHEEYSLDTSIIQVQIPLINIAIYSHPQVHFISGQGEIPGLSSNSFPSWLAYVEAVIDIVHYNSISNAY